MKLFALTSALLFLCFSAIGIRIWLKGSFAETEIGRNKNMKKLGINCIRDEEIKMHLRNADIPAAAGCGTCSLMQSCSRVKKET